MADKLRTYQQLADDTAAQVIGSYQEWTAFLATMGRLYKYPFHEQLLIHAQRPNATACADYDFWKKRMHRYVRGGSTGIALIGNSGGKPFLRFVFDVSELDADISETEVNAIPADPSVKNYSYAIVDGDVYYRENSVMVKPHLSAAAQERVKAMIGLRDCVRELIDLQMDEFTPDSAIQEKQKELGTLYDAFSKKYGLINDRTNRLAFDRDSSYYLLCSLEVLDEDGKMKRKADMFTKRTIKQHTHITSAETAMDALAVSIGERAKVDLPFMAQLTGHTEEDLEKELTGVIFRDIRCAENPDHIPKTAMDLSRYPLVTADEYLSGKANVDRLMGYDKSGREKDEGLHKEH